MNTKTQDTHSAARANGVGLWRLVSCFWHLGFRNGIRYWKIMRRADKDPDMLGLWAFRCRAEALDEEVIYGDIKRAEALRAWADELDAHRAANTDAEPRRDVAQPNRKDTYE